MGGSELTRRTDNPQPASLRWQTVREAAGVDHDGAEGWPMSVLLDELKGLVPPPAAVASPQWEDALEQVGFEFPADYREFVDAYGEGTFERSEYVGLEVRAPHSSALGLRGEPGLKGFVARHVNRVRPLFVGSGEGTAMWAGEPYPMYPDSGGLLSWGRSQQNDQFFWLTQDADPDRWPVVGWSRHDASTLVFDGGMAEFLIALFTGRVDHFGSWQARGLSWKMRHDWLRRYP
jgi:hypothetical protein